MDKQTNNWHNQKELGSPIQLRLMFFFFRHFPLFVLRILAFPVSFFYWLFGAKQRRFSKEYLARISEYGKPLGYKPAKSSYKHFAAFALSLCEKVQAWGGRIYNKDIDYSGDVDAFVGQLNNSQGLILIISHLGNAEILRALADFKETRADRAFPVISIVDYEVNAGFSKMLEEVNPCSMQRLINAKNIGVETIGVLEECLSQGGVVVIAADRLEKGIRSVTVPFLGKDALFPQGPFYLVTLLKYSAYFIFGLRKKTFGLDGRYDMIIQKCAVDTNCSRKERDTKVEALARDYAHALETHCLERPYQWYNFYDFWAM
jgi:predicted LPLAT superfamily acyltransferase